MTSIGHNSKEQLKSIVERIERLEEQKAEVSTDIKEVYSEAKSNGFDTKALRRIIAIRKKDPHQRQEEDAILDTYMHALGMLVDTPLGQAAIERDLTPRKPIKNRKKGDALQDAVDKLGEPAKLTEEEKERGVTAAFTQKDGTRMTLRAGGAT